MNFAYLRTLGYDGTVVNTVSKNEVLTQLEKAAGGPLQWLICQLHENELPLRYLFKKLDGKTTGSSSFNETIEMELQKSENHTIDKNFIVLSQKVIRLNAIF